MGEEKECISFSPFKSIKMALKSWHFLVQQKSNDYAVGGKSRRQVKGHKENFLLVCFCFCPEYIFLMQKKIKNSNRCFLSV